MAVVQISRIQHRRGRSAASGVPQLSSGEIGWAIDSQKLYIGNGSVSEGAPNVGNTEVLTTNSDIISLAGQYTYRTADNVQTGASGATPVSRSLALKLDDVVSVKDFGADGDSSDQTAAIQRAVDQLFIGTLGGEYKNITLHIPAGQYLITAPIYIPPYTNIVGDGMEKTLLTGTGSSVFYTKNGDSVAGAYADDSTNDSTNQPRYLRVEGMTISHSSYGGAIILQNTRDSIFKDLRVKGTWSYTDGADVDLGAFKLRSGSLGSLDCNNNLFNNVQVENMAYAFTSDDDTNFNTFKTGKIHTAGYGFKFGINTVIGAAGQLTGPSQNTIENFDFRNVNKQAIIIDKGTNNTLRNNKFNFCGNDAADSHNAVTEVVRFGTVGNISVQDFFQRTADLTVNTNYNTGTYPPEIKGPKSYDNNYTTTVKIGGRNTSTYFMGLPADTQTGTVHVHYTYRAQNSPGPIHRRGIMKIDWNKGVSGTAVSFQDDFQVSGNDTLTEALVFTAALNGAKVLINCKNTTLAEGNDADEFNFELKHYA